MEIFKNGRKAERQKATAVNPCCLLRSVSLFENSSWIYEASAHHAVSWQEFPTITDDS